jgi:DNA-binding transcriptional LysR family regulator
MAFSLRQLRYFAAVAEHRSVSSAAVAMAISQSTVTESLRDLEYDMGFPLLERHARGVQLTQRGHQFLRYTLRILADVADARRFAADDKPQVAGKLALGVTRLVAGYVLPELLSRFRRSFPAIELEIIEDQSDYLEHLMIGGELDVGLMIRVANEVPSALGSRAMAISPQHAWLPSGHPAAAQSQISLAALATEPHILLTLDEVEGRLQYAWRRLKLKPPIAFRTGSVEAVRSLVAAGHGVAVLPQLIYRPWSLDGDRIEARPLIEDLPTSDVLVTWRRGAQQKPETQGFIEVATNWRRTRTGTPERGRAASW